MSSGNWLPRCLTALPNTVGSSMASSLGHKRNASSDLFTDQSAKRTTTDEIHSTTADEEAALSAPTAPKQSASSEKPTDRFVYLAWQEIEYLHESPDKYLLGVFESVRDANNKVKDEANQKECEWHKSYGKDGEMQLRDEAVEEGRMEMKVERVKIVSAKEGADDVKLKRKFPYDWESEWRG